MKWLVQYMKNEPSFDDLISSLERLNINYELVKALPFTNKIVKHNELLNGKNLNDIQELEIDSTESIFVIGSYSLAKIAKQRNFTPGAFINENFNNDAWANGWGKDNLLNSDYNILKFGEFKPKHSKFFARPLEDTKSFNGQIFELNDFLKFQKNALLVNSEQLNFNTEILISSIKKIFNEYRFFIVDKKISTYSMYKRGVNVFYDKNVDVSAIDYVNEMISIYNPDIAYVLDVAYTENGYKIIEVNNINSSGFYAIDLNKFVISIEDLGQKYNNNKIIKKDFI